MGAPLAPGGGAALAARRPAARPAARRHFGAPLPRGRAAAGGGGGGGGRAVGSRGGAAAAAGREAAGRRRRLRAAGDGAAAALEGLAAGVGALGLLPGGGPAAAGALRAAGGRGAAGRRHVPQDAARHPAALRRLQEVCLRPAALAMRAPGTLGVLWRVTWVWLGGMLRGIGRLGTVLKPHCAEHTVKACLVLHLHAGVAPQGKMAKAQSSERNSVQLVDVGTSYVKEMRNCTPRRRL